MKAIAKLKYLRIAPRKVRMVANAIRGKKVLHAQTLLRFAVQRPAMHILKTLNSAIASAKKNANSEESNLYISQIFVDEGPKLKRGRPRARGSAYPIQKKTSHLTIVLDEIQEGVKAVSSEQGKEAESKEDKKEAKRGGRSWRREKQIGKTERRGGKTRIFQRKAV